MAASDSLRAAVASERGASVSLYEDWMRVHRSTDNGEVHRLVRLLADLSTTGPAHMAWILCGMSWLINNSERSSRSIIEVRGLVDAIEGVRSRVSGALVLPGNRNGETMSMLSAAFAIGLGRRPFGIERLLRFGRWESVMGIVELLPTEEDGELGDLPLRIDWLTEFNKASLARTERYFERVGAADLAVPPYVLANQANRYSLVRRFAAPGSKVLDFGCGTGEGATLLADGGYDVLGYEPHFEPETSEEVPVTSSIEEASSFFARVVCCFEVIEHVEPALLLDFLEGLRRVALGPTSAIVLLSTPLAGSRAGRDRPRNPNHTHEFGFYELAELVSGQFRIEECLQANSRGSVVLRLSPRNQLSGGTQDLDQLAIGAARVLVAEAKCYAAKGEDLWAVETLRRSARLVVSARPVDGALLREIGLASLRSLALGEEVRREVEGLFGMARWRL